MADSAGETTTLMSRVAGHVAGALDRGVATVFPGWGVRRQKARTSLAAYRAVESSRRRKKRSGFKGSADAAARDSRGRDALSEECKEQERNSSFTRGLLDLFETNAVGSGHRLRVLTDDDGWNSEAEARMAAWGEDKRRCDQRGVKTLHEIVGTGLRSVVRDGDIGIIKVRGGMLQAIEDARIVTPAERAADMLEVKARGHTIVNGVETNAKGRVVAYWVGPWTRHGTGIAAKDAKRYSTAWMWHVYRADRFSASRGVPLMHAALDDLAMMDEYLDSALVTAKVAACFGIAIYTDTPEADGRGRGEETVNKEGTAELWEEVGPGIVERLKPGEKIESISPNHPPTQLPQFMYTLARFAMFGLGLPVELFNASDANYSSIRAALVNLAYPTLRRWQKFAQIHMYRPIYEWKMRQFMEYEGLAFRDDWQKHEWVAPGWDWVDPVKGAFSSIKAIDHGLSSVEIECSRRGLNWEDVLKGNARVIAAMQEVAAELKIDWLILWNAAVIKMSPANSGGQRAVVKE